MLLTTEPTFQPRICLLMGSPLYCFIGHPKCSKDEALAILLDSQIRTEEMDYHFSVASVCDLQVASTWSDPSGLALHISIIGRQPSQAILSLSFLC